MTWMNRLYETYEAAQKLDLPFDEKIMPIGHIPQNAHINIAIDGDGNFLRASVLEKTQIILPATENSAGRTSGEAPHPLADKIQYVAQDYADYGGKKKPYFDGYLKQLAKWCESPDSHKKVRAVYQYVSKGSVARDLIEAKVLHVGDDGLFLESWPEEDDRQSVPQIFKVLTKQQGKIYQGSALVCWTVEEPGCPQCDTWTDESIAECWNRYLDSAIPDKGVCCVTGRESILAANHPAKLRRTNDQAKLVSANDSGGFTFRGRFTDPNGCQAITVGSEVTQKAHNALRWLINRQGQRKGDQVYVTWAISGKGIPEPLKDSFELLSEEIVYQPQEDTSQTSEHDYGCDIGESFAHQFNKYIAGYRTKLAPNEQIVVMGLDSASPGRMAITYYRELLASEFLDRIHKWHDEFSWPQRVKIEVADPSGKKKPKPKTIWPVAAPVPRTIAQTAYGDVLRSNSTLEKSLIERLVPCIVDGRPFPRDVVLSAVRRVSNRNGYKSDEKWRFDRDLCVTCAIFRGFHLRHPNTSERREYSMSLEQDRTTRDYLYGRLLAIAERIERIALSVGNEERPTTAERLMQRFADRPFSTWRNIELSLTPYMQRLKSNRPGFLVNRKKELDAIMTAFDPDDFKKDRPLSGEFLLGYHCQRQEWKNSKSETEADKDDE